MRTVTRTRNKIVAAVFAFGLLGFAGCADNSASTGSGHVDDPFEQGLGLAAEIEEGAADVEESEPGAEQLRQITEYANVGDNTVRVTVDGELTDADRESLAETLFEIPTENQDSLETLLIVDASGEETEHDR